MLCQNAIFRQGESIKIDAAKICDDPLVFQPVKLREFRQRRNAAKTEIDLCRPALRSFVLCWRRPDFVAIYPAWQSLAEN
jgi:hypothetical protein